MAGAALAVSLAAGQAVAATVVGATSITITSALPNYLQVAELQAFDFGGVNVALAANGGVATALSQYDAHMAPENGPGEVNDGAFPANYDYTYNPVVPGVYHSAGAGGDEYLTVTFAAPATLASIAIYGRGDCCQERDIYNVTIRGANNEVLFSGQLDARTSGSASIGFDQPQTGGAVPEPATWAMMVIGFGGAGALLRRRQMRLA